MVANPGFFGKHEQGIIFTEQPQSRIGFVDVGGDGDCGFRAVAATLLDEFMRHPRRHATLWNKLLTAHFDYFSEPRRSSSLMTHTERVTALMNHLSLAKLIQSLAFTLRQLAVTEMCHHPEVYRGAFVEQHEGTTPEMMRKPTTWIDENGIAALAHALSLPIEVQVIDRLKTLPKSYHYHPSAAAHPPVVIQLLGGHYTPRVSAPEKFAAVKGHIHPVLNPMSPTKEEQDPDLSEIYAAIAADDHRKVEAFESTYHRLCVMVTAGELTKEDLLTMYVKGMKDSDYLVGRVAEVGFEYGHQAFFDEILKAKQGRQHLGFLTLDAEQSITAELIHALSRAISIGHMQSEELFGLLDKKQDGLMSQF